MVMGSIPIGGFCSAAFGVAGLQRERGEACKTARPMRSHVLLATAARRRWHHLPFRVTRTASMSAWRRAQTSLQNIVQATALAERWAEAPVKIARMTLTIKLDRNWSSFQLANSAPPLSVTDSAIAPSARMAVPRRQPWRASPCLPGACSAASRTASALLGLLRAGRLRMRQRARRLACQSKPLLPRVRAKASRGFERAARNQSRQGSVASALLWARRC